MDPLIKILLADDDEEDKLIFSESFNGTNKKADLDFVSDGVEVLDYLRQAYILNELPAIIILDLNMPRLNGTDTLRLLKENPVFKSIPVIIFSTSINEIERRACIDIGAIDYVIKPSNLIDAVNNANYFYEHAVTSMESRLTVPSDRLDISN